MFRRAPRLLSIALVSIALVGCGGGPPADQIRTEIKEAVQRSGPGVFEGGEDSTEVLSIKVGEWKKERMDKVTAYEATWTAKLRFKEPVACIVAEVDGKRIVKVVAEKGYELPFEGRCGGLKTPDGWQMVGAGSQSKNNDFFGPGAWKPLADKVPDMRAGYEVIVAGQRVNPKFRTSSFEPLSKLQPCIVEGSDEHKKLVAEAQENARKQQEIYQAQQKRAQEAAAERQRLQQEQQALLQAQAIEQQRQYQEEQARIQAEAAERQRLAREEQLRKQAEAAEAARVAREEAAKKAAAEKHARLLGVMKPFQSATGAVIVAEAGPHLGTVLLDATIDEEKLSVSGNAINLRDMPFKEFTYTGSVDERGVFTFKSSLGGEPVVYTASGEKLASRAGFTISSLADADRARMEALITLGKRLGSAPATPLAIETLDGEAAKTREPQLKLSGLNGAVFHRNRLDTRVNPLFAADMANNRSYAWKGGEVVSVRLSEPVKGTGLFIRGTAAPSTEMIVTINGVHQVTIPSIPKLGDVIVTLPADLEVLDIRFQATGAVTARTIGLMK